MSDLLNSASLVMIPSGYKEDVVYSPIPTDGSGDLSFTRASNGTRINSAGLVEDVPWNFIEQSSNLGSWPNAGVTITTGITDAYGTTNAVTMSNISSGDNTDYIAKFSNTMDLPVGTVINTSVYLKGSGSIGVAIERGNTGDYFITKQIFTLTSAWVRYDFAYTLPSGTRNGIHFYVTNLTGTTATSVDICFPQINYGSTAKPYFPTTDRLNVPRLTYQNGGGGCPSLLLEKQSTNLFTYSEQFDNADWTKLNTTVSANSTTSPDGTQNADTVTPTTTNGVHRIEQDKATASQVFTQSIFAKANGYNFIALENGGEVAYFNISTGVVGTVSAGTASIQNMGNGWYRCIFTATALNTKSYFYVANADNSVSFAGDSTSGIFVWGCQFEAGSYATSYISTTSASATRVADACSKTGISSLIGQTEGVIFADINNQLVNPALDTRIQLSDGSTNNWIFLGLPDGSTGGSVRCYVLNAATSFNMSFYSSSALAKQRYKIAFAYKSGSFALYINGVLEGASSTTGTIPSCSVLAIGGATPTSITQDSIQEFNQVTLFPTRLTNAELASLTTI
jgi:hypothetical protein